MVIGVLDADWGEVGKTFIVLNGSISVVELLAYCRLKMAKFKVPKSLLLLDALPKSDTGKINRGALKKWII